jgi:uncharacterized Zn finger protein
MAWSEFDDYLQSKPRRVAGGIKAQSRSGAFGKSWWAKRWLAVLETFGIGGRLARGRAYARSGQVLSIDIEPGTVLAKVQGSRPTPYKVKIEMKKLDGGAEATLAQALGAQVLFVARLLAGEMPEGIEEAFSSAGLSLFPVQAADLRTDCSCPDWSNPCKHIAAVYCLLGEEFDRDPFLLFRLRGIDRERLVGLLGRAAPVPDEPAGDEDEAKPVRRASRKSASGVAASEPAPVAAVKPAGTAPATAKVAKRKSPARRPPAVAAQPLATAHDEFWEGAELPANFWDPVQAPPVDAALLARLGNFPFWRGAVPFREALEPVYPAAGRKGLDVFVGEASPAPAGKAGGRR